MNSLKKVAVIAAIISAVALLITIILTPFAVSGVIDTYNGIIEKAEENADSYWIQTDLKKNITELTISYPEHYGSILIEESPDDQIYILNQDWGFEYLLPVVQYNGDSATLDFNWKHDYKLNEENILQAIAQEINPIGPRCTIIQLPSHVSLKLDDDYMDSLYYMVDFVYCDFANYEEVRQQMDDWYGQHQVKHFRNNFLAEVNDELNEIRHMRLNITNNCQYFDNAEYFQVEFADEYAALKNMRSDLLKRAYNFRKEYGTQTVEQLDSEYLELSAAIEKLCATEKSYDLLSAKVYEAQHKLEYGEISEEQFSSINDTCFTQQVDLDLTISKLREKFENYLHAEILLQGSSENLMGEDGVSEAPSSEVVTPLIPSDVEMETNMETTIPAPVEIPIPVQ